MTGYLLAGRGDKLRDRVDRGVKLLDSIAPGWENEIDKATLRMQDGCGCILGQTFDQGPLAENCGFAIALEELDITYEQARYYGFTLSRYDVDTVDDFPPMLRDWEHAWNMLLAEWLRRLP